ncbi:monocarboxylate permease [Gloeophyllum trabeum ATCC 11539]|uniref:Monocarboxylate permease n=1 Tax=Gloeophyllum trabeum (strain ATCC 11539 / FP-39264 / Madison 617) TaxID=670483 RepID=S7Q4F0_GLOTA|nr:monocarboxylate permease [Gloeophyllum trabeum ATCC 11539]EPQ54896.1 monocarboxylate permease [Gloeophyllum trabeum ATCC 11539]
MSSDLEKGSLSEKSYAAGATLGNPNASTTQEASAFAASIADSEPTAVDHNHHPDDAFVEGGLRGYLTVLGAFLALFCSFGLISSFGTFQSWYADHQLYRSPSAISWIGSLQLWVFFFSGGFIGRIFDCHGPRLVMVLGALLHSFSLMMTSLSTEYYQFILCQGILFGLSTGMLFYPSLASVSTHFKRYRATAIGIAVAGSSVGGIVYPIMLDTLFPRLGFAWTVRILGFMGLGCSSIAVALVSRRPSPGKTPATRWCDCHITKDAPFLLLVLGSFLVCFGIFIPYFYIVSYSAAHAVSVTRGISRSFYLLSIMNAGGVLGRIAPAYLSDAVGRFNLLVPSALLSGVLCLALWTTAETRGALVAFAFLYGFFSGAFISGINPCVAQISEMSQVGTRIGMLYTLVSLPSLFGGPAAGALLARAHGSYIPMTILSGVTLVVGSLIILCSKLKIDRRVCAQV